MRYINQEFRDAFSSVVHLLFCSCAERRRRRGHLLTAGRSPADVPPTPAELDGQPLPDQALQDTGAGGQALPPDGSERVPLQQHQLQTDGRRKVGEIRDRRPASPVVGGSATAPAVVYSEDEDDELADDALFEDLPLELRQEALSVLGHLRPQLPLGDRAAVPVVIQLNQRRGGGGGSGGNVAGGGRNVSAAAVIEPEMSSYFSV